MPSQSLIIVAIALLSVSPLAICHQQPQPKPDVLPLAVSVGDDCWMSADRIYTVAALAFADVDIDAIPWPNFELEPPGIGLHVRAQCSPVRSVSLDVNFIESVDGAVHFIDDGSLTLGSDDPFYEQRHTEWFVRFDRHVNFAVRFVLNCRFQTEPECRSGEGSKLFLC